MAEIISGKIVSAEVRKRISSETKDFIQKTGITPALAVILVGDDPASAVYVRNKHKGCLEVGFTSYQIEMPKETTQMELLSKIDELNKDEKETLVNKLRSVKITPQYMLLYMNMIQDEVLKMDVARDFFESIDILKLTYWKEGNLAANSYEEMKKAYGL